MEVLTVDIPYKTSNSEFRLYAIGDEHVGTKHFAEKQFTKMVNTIKNDPNGMWIDMGDACEFIAPSDPRWDVGGVADWVSPDNIATDQCNYFTKLVEPIKSKCIGKVEGNHCDAMRIHYHIDVHKNICNALGIPSLGYSGYVRFRFKRANSNESHTVTGYFTHGSGSAATKGGKLNRLQRIMDNFEADIYGIGHMHELITDSRPYLSLDDTNHIVHRVKVGAVTGCWFRTYTEGVRASYGEKRGYAPVSIGYPVFTIDPGKGTITVKAVEM